MKKGFVGDIERLTLGNEDYRRVLYTGHHVQLVLMSLQPGEEIGEEVHEDRDQFFRIEAGEGEFTIDGARHRAGADFAVIVPAGARALASYSVVRPSKCSCSRSAPGFVRWTTSRRCSGGP